jgi:hypothetical protein
MPPKLTTTFEKVWSKEINPPSIPLHTKRVGVLVTCPHCNRSGKKIVIIYPMAAGTFIAFRGRKKCGVVRCSSCKHLFTISMSCDKNDQCECKLKCLAIGIALVDADYLLS